MKIHILFNFTESPAGGGNQFLRSLRKYLQSIGIYVEDHAGADVILFNSHHYVAEIAKIKREYPDKIFVHRVDGPMKIYNKMTDRRDNIVNIANNLIADGTVFQSEWSRKQNYKLGLKNNSFEEIIVNAPDPTVFNSKGKTHFLENKRIRLVATSWSNNRNKGFDVYKWLDDNLNFNNYEMVFIGNSPIKFRNIKHILPVKSDELTKELRKSDIFVFASKIEACSNSLLEAMY